MGFVHFSHDHPLILNEETKHDGEEVRHCNGCLEEIVPGPYYCCSKCDFFLHKLCAELPREMQHHMHPQHPLTLLASRNVICNVCRGKWKNFTYTCFPCDFDVDIICASLMERKIEHKSHKHPLILLRRPALIFCFACGTEHKGIFYFCTTCVQFWIHKNCASLPSTITHSDHRHRLSLAYSLPEDYLKFRYTCDICGKEFDKVSWFYYCKECRYLAHVNCTTSKAEAFMSILLPDRKTKNLTEDDPRLFHLPVSDESVSLINHFLKMDLGENKRSREINHFSHDHPLILFDVQNNEESCSESKPSLLNEMKNDNICNGCIRPISAPFYSCLQCNFFLHKWCVELPTEVQHPCHPEHTLVLLPKCPIFFGLFMCQCCQIYSNGFSFSCTSCKFYLDVNCASLPSSITHEAHAHHRLILKQLNDRLKCNACHQFVRRFQFGFVCDTCDFKLHLECALLPRKTRHRYEEHHPLTLTYSPVKDDSDEYFCEICEEELDPKKWFYHSGDCVCNQWFHARCIHPYRPKIKFGGTIKIANHLHPLTLSELTEDDSKCNSCGEDIYYYSFHPFFCNVTISFTIIVVLNHVMNKVLKFNLTCAYFLVLLSFTLLQIIYLK